MVEELIALVKMHIWRYTHLPRLLVIPREGHDIVLGKLSHRKYLSCPSHLKEVQRIWLNGGFSLPRCSLRTFGFTSTIIISADVVLAILQPFLG